MSNLPLTSTKFDGKKGANRSQGPGDAASRSPAHSTLRARLPPSVLQGSSTMQALLDCLTLHENSRRDRTTMEQIRKWWKNKRNNDKMRQAQAKMSDAQRNALVELFKQNQSLKRHRRDDILKALNDSRRKETSPATAVSRCRPFA